MQLPEYITLAEVQRVCRELGLSDWTKMPPAPQVRPEEARIILAAVNTAGMDVPLEEFRAGLEVAEIEGDILKALLAKNPAKLEALQRQLARAKLALCQAEAAKLG